MATDNNHDNDESEVPPAKKPRLDEAPKKETSSSGLASSRRRSTRSVQHHARQEEEMTVASEEEEVDDPDFDHLSDSDDDSDFAPSENKKENASLPEFTLRGRGRGRGRGKGRGGKGRGESAPGKRQNSENSTAGAGREDAVLRKAAAVSTTSQSGDFVMAKEDTKLDQPPIWRVDGKSLLQKFEAFEKDGKVLYRNISMYSGWTLQGESLYKPVKTKLISQSGYDIVVELDDENNASNVTPADPTALPSEEAAKTAAVISKVPSSALAKQPISSAAPQEDVIFIPEELNQHMPTFEIFLQTLISQALDNNFLSEIYEENDEYFVDRVKVMEELTTERKEKMRSIVTWGDNFWKSLQVWPSVNVMSSTGNNTCDACSQVSSNKLALFYGQPYDETTLKSREEAEKEAPTKNYNVCDQCAKMCELYSALCHRKYDYFSKCKATVTNIRVSQPSKNTTTILRELLGNDAWITGLFRNMCTTLVRVDRLFEEHQSRSSGAAGVKPEQSLAAPPVSPS